MADYRQLETGIATVRGQIEQFETQDFPAFRQWQARTFGPLLTELRATCSELQEHQDLFAEIEDEMFFSGCKDRTAYRRVLKRREAFARGEEPPDEYADPGSDDPTDDEPPQEDPLPMIDVKTFDRMTAKQQRAFRAEYEFAATCFEAITGIVPPSLDEVLERDRRAAAKDSISPAPERKTTIADKIKQLYRKLVRQLHPDKEQGLTQRELDLWHEVQDAYQRRDLERLECLAGRIEMRITGEARHLALSTLRSMCAELRAVLAGLKSWLALVKSDPAWNFRRLTTARLRALETKLRRQLTTDLRILSSQLAEARKILSTYQRAAAPSRRRKPPRAPQRYEQTEFF
jgi:hypothetical protein